MAIYSTISEAGEKRICFLRPLVRKESGTNESVLVRVPLRPTSPRVAYAMVASATQHVTRKQSSILKEKKKKKKKLHVRNYFLQPECIQITFHVNVHVKRKEEKISRA